MDASTVAVVALGGAVLVLSALLVLVSVLHQRAEASLRADNTRLTNLVVARDPREFAVLQKATAPKPPAERAEPEPVLIGA